MKNTSLFRRILSVALVVAMVCSLLVPSISAETPKAVTAETAATATTEELELIPMDPGALESHKLAEGEANDNSATKAGFESADVVRVSIVLDKASTLSAGFSTKGIAGNAAAKAYREGLRADQAAMTAKIEKTLGSKLDVEWNLTLAANIISANVQYGQIEAIKALDGVKDVFLENRYEPERDEEIAEPENGSASYMIGANITWANGYTGAGSKVAIIDTGADTLHQSFSGEGLEYAFAQTAAEKEMSYDAYVDSLNLLTADKIEAVKDQLNANIGSGEAAYRNTKVAYGYNYVDKNVSYIDHDLDTQGEHGSHVSGISTANRFIKVGEEFKPALEAVGTQGVAPDAQLVVMKVFGKGGGAYDSDYMVAIEDAIVLGCDSANLSLGGGAPGFSFSGNYEDIMNEIVENGMVVAFSAGNSGMWYDTPKNAAMQYPYLYADDINYATDGSPGSFVNTLCVASVDNAGQTGFPLYVGDLAVFYNESATYGNKPIATLAGEDRNYIFFENTGVDGNDNDLLAPYAEAIAGKIVLCSRGASSFYQKVNAAAAAGAIGVVIYNNDSAFNGMNLTGITTDIPAVIITKADGMAIKGQSEAVTDDEGNVLYYTGTMSFAEELQVQVPEISDTVEVSSFSSYGTPTSMVLKPEILAPGGKIYSVNGYNQLPANQGGGYSGGHDEYELMSGTSMASPQVAGMAAVMGQYIRENNLCSKTGRTERQLINSLLMSTAHPVFDSYGDYWAVIRVGAGLANVADAITAKSYIMMDEGATLFPDSAKDGKVKAELGDDPNYTGEYTYSFTLYPMEGKKDFTLRTDIFTQGIAGNGGYGMLADTGTMLIGSETTYEVNGQTYEDNYTLEADVNKDGETNAADAQAILDYLTGELAEGAAFDAAAADVDGDEKITTYDAKLILDSAETPVISITEPTKVTVHIKVSDEWIASLVSRYTTGGFYVEGYTYVLPEADEEGNMDAVHSIPILGFCGSYTGPAMLDRTSVVDELYGTGKEPYIANKNINYMTVKTAEGQSYIFTGNPYAVEDQFPADRLALNSNSTIAGFNFLNIRNIATVGFAVQDENGNVLTSSASPATKYAAYYYVNGGTWENTSPSNFSVGKKLTGLAAEGDKITVGFYALPEYYGIVAAKMDGEVATSGSINNAALKKILEAGMLGDGAGIKYTVTLDDTAPVVSGVMQDLITGNMVVKASDNRYIAYVAVTNKSGSEVYYETVPKQAEAGQEVEVPLTFAEDVKLPKEVVLLVADYAGNETAFKVNLGGNGGSQNSNAGKMFGFVPAGNTYGPGTGNRVWTIDPASVNVGGSAFTGVELFSNVEFNVIAAEYVDGYVFMAADDGWFYAADINALNEAAPVSYYRDTIATVYDMALNFKDNTLYVLDNTNNIYSMDIVTGELTPAFSVTLPGATGDAATANRLAIDDNSTFYVGSYGNTNTAKLYKFHNEVVEEEPESELGTLLVSWGFETAEEFDTWTIVNANGDAKTWERKNNKPHTGSYHLQNSYNSSVSVDDWAISPAFNLTGVDGASVSAWIGNNSLSYTEKFTVYAGTSADIEQMTAISDQYAICLNDYKQVVIDLADYVGQPEVYVAIRHHDSVDMFTAYLDDVEIYTTVNEEPGEPEPITAVEVEAELVGPMGVAYNYNNGGAFAWDHNTGKLYLANNINATYSSDHYLWVVNTETGKGEKVNNEGSTLRGSVRGLFVVPGRVSTIAPTDVATALVAEPDSLELLKGMTASIKVSVLPWTLTDKDVTFTSADETVATVRADGVVTAVNAGSTKITVETVAKNEAGESLTAEVTVNVTMPPEVELRGVIWDENGKGQASVFKSNNTAAWEALAEVGALRWATLIGDTVYGSTDDTLYKFDADTYELTDLGTIVSDWIPSDADELPQDYVDAFAEMGHSVGRVFGITTGGTYLTMLDPEAGKLVYFDMSDDFGSDLMATISFGGREDYQYIDWSSFSIVTDPDCAFYYVMTESGALYKVLLTHDGNANVEKLAETNLKLDGVADVTNSVWASMKYNAGTNFLYISLYNGSDDNAYLYAIDVADTSRMSCTGDFRAKVWPVVGLYEYEPLTDLTMTVNPTEITVYEGLTADVNVKVKLGETNEYTVAVGDPTVCSFENGVVTGLKAGETDITFTTVDSNAAGEKLTATVHVTVKGAIALNVSVKGQVTDDRGARFTTILLDGPTASKNGAEAPFDVASGSRTGDLYLAGTASEIVALDAETYEPVPVSTYDPDPAGAYSQGPAMDIANYPCFINADGEYVKDKALFTTNDGWVIRPNQYGWNLKSYIPDMAAIAFCGTNTAEDNNGNEIDIYVYYILTTAGELWELDINYAEGKIAGLDDLMNTGITVTDQSALSMTFAIGMDASSTTGGEEVYGLVVANNENKTLWFIDFQTGEVGYVGILDAENLSGLSGYYDDLVAVDEEPAPDPVGEVIASFGFETEDDVAAWTMVDSDNDGYIWSWNHNITSWYAADSQPEYDTFAHQGTGCIVSASYINTVGALTPDNWAVSPAIDLSNASDDVAVSFYAKGVDSKYCEEIFTIYAGTTPDVADMVAISGDFTATGSWKKYSASLAAYAGEQTVYVAIRHHDVTDQFILDLDDVEIQHNFTEVEPTYTAPDASALRANVGDGVACMNAAIAPASIEMTKMGETVNETVGGTNAIKAELIKEPVRMPVDETTAGDGNVKIVLTEDEAVTNGLFTVTYNADVLTFVDAVSELPYKSIHHEIQEPAEGEEPALRTGVITIAYASAEEIAAESVLATLNFTYTGDSVETTVVVTTLERNDNVAVEEDPLVIEVKAEKACEHVYGDPVWTWAEDYSSAKATFTCTLCNESVDVDATVNVEEQTLKTVYTATVEFNNTTYTDKKEVEGECQITFFTDIDEYPHGTTEHSAIEWAYLAGITAGTGDGTTFEPAKVVSRAEAMVFLYAAEGRPEYEMPEAKFTDVKKKHWAYNAVMWAVANGITGGTGDGTTFSPDKTCSRAEILQFFYAAEKKPGYTIENPYSDVKNKHWYKDGAIWAYENGLERGENGKFNATTECTRLSTVLYLYRYITGEGRIE